MKLPKLLLCFSALLLVLSLILAACSEETVPQPTTTPAPRYVTVTANIAPAPVPTFIPTVSVTDVSISTATDGIKESVQSFPSFSTSDLKATGIFAINAQSNLAAIGGTYNGTKAITLWDLVSGKRKNVLLSPGGGNITALAFSPVEEVLVSVDHLGMVYFWELAANRHVKEIDLGYYKASIFDSSFSPGQLLFSPNGRYLAINREQLWDLKAGKRFSSQNTSMLHNVQAFSQDSRFMAASNFKASVIYDFEKDDFIIREGFGDGVVFSKDGKSIFSYASPYKEEPGGYVEKWTVGAKEARTLATHTSKNKLYIVGDFALDATKWVRVKDSKLEIYDASTVKIIATCQTNKPAKEIWQTKFSSDSKTIFTFYRSNVIDIWDVATGKIKKSISLI
jgi:WD40 repeat protein